MFNVGGGEVLVILLIALIVLGPDKLPNAARQAGKYLGDFRRMSHGFQRELRDAMDLGDLGDLMNGTSKPTSPGGPTAQAPADTGATAATDDTTAPTTTAPPEASANGSGPVANGAATTGANGTNGTNGPTNPNGTSATIRKRSIEVDGPSASFD